MCTFFLISNGDWDMVPWSQEVSRVFRGENAYSWVWKKDAMMKKHRMTQENLKRTPDRLAAAAAKSLQSCPTLYDPIDGSPPGSSVPGILQARTLEWVAISFSNAWKWKGKVKSLSCVRLLATPWTAAHQAPPSMGFPRQEYWSGVPLPSLRQTWDIMKTSLKESHFYLVRGKRVRVL